MNSFPIVPRVRNYINVLWELSLVVFMAYYSAGEVIFRFFIPPKLKSLRGEIILVTGAGNGIGKEICLQLAKSAATIVCWDRIKRDNENTVAELKAVGIKAYAYEVDISERSQVEVTALKVKREVGNVSVVINNADVPRYKEFLKYSPDELERIFKTNVFSQFWVLREFLPKMIEEGHGHIVNTCSLIGLQASKHTAPYCGSKFAVNGYVEALKEEIKLHPLSPDIKFTLVYTMAVNTKVLTNQAKYSPRFPTLTPLLEPKYVAEKLIDGLRRNYEYVYCPASSHIYAILGTLAPTKLRQASIRFLKTYLEPIVLPAQINGVAK